MSDRQDSIRLTCQTLESREVPTVNPLLQESFETAIVPNSPAGTAWSSNSSNGFITSRLSASDGKVSLASLGDSKTESRFWFSQQLPADAGVSVSLRSDNPGPISVVTRAQGLNGTSPSYLAARLSSSGRQLDVVEVSNGTTRTLASVKVNTPTYGQWYNVRLQPQGVNVSAQVQRLDTKQFLNSSGNWQSSAVDAATAKTSISALNGQVGVQRNSGGTGMIFIDQVVVTPPPSQAFSTNFDTNRPTDTLSDWQRWSSDNSAGFQISSARSLSPGNGFASSGQSNTTSRAWLRTPQPTDVQASVYAFADGLIPVTVMVRGSGLDTTKPSYYGLSLVRGVEARLVAVVSGVETTLSAIRSNNWVSSTWLRMTLIANGGELRAVISRADNGQFLTANGTWQDSPTPALSATDSRISIGSGVGVARPARVAGTVTVDDVDVRPAPSVTGPKVTLSASQTGSTFTGDVTFTVTGERNAPPRRVEYRLNGVARYSAATTNSSWTLDTTNLANGPQKLTIWASDEIGNASTTEFNFTTTNANPTPTTRPALPQKLEHIRIAQLAYNGNPMGAFEQARLGDSVDLVIPNPRFQQAIQQASPDTTQLLYSNVSNLYQDLLTNWLSYADRSGTSRELAFYHVSRATPFQGSSPAAQPVNWLWSAVRTTGTASTEVTSAARSGTTAGINLGATGDTLQLGYPDRFRELNVVLKRPATAGWQSQFEYVSAVNADGTPRTWSLLRIDSDSTNSFAANGRIVFDPPRDWVSAKLTTTSASYFYVRLRNTSGSAAQAPVLNTVLGRDYVNANGQQTGTIPSFDYTADVDGDGYLNDAEYASRATGNDARFVYESRLFYPFYGQMRFATNPSSSAVRRWAADYHASLLKQYPLADGLFLDNSNGRLPIGNTPVIEPTAGYNEDYAGMVRVLMQAVAPKLVFTNTAGGNADATPITAVSTGVLEEFLLRPTEANWATVVDMSNLVKSRLNADNPSPYTILDTHPGSSSLNDPRLKSGTLAYYYLLADPNKTMLMLYGGFSPSGPWSASWIPAISTNVGKPTTEMSVFASGKDPENAALDYKVFGRAYDNALVLYKPRSYTLGTGTGTLNDATATTHNLGGNYRVLSVDGTLSPVVNQVSLRNGEGVVLMKA
jgi:hypothetical protein